MSSIFLHVLELVAVILLALIIAKTQNKTDKEIWPFYAKKPLSQPEQVLYFRLVEALPEHIILAQVQLSRILGIKRGYSHQTWLNRINRMSADFVVCNRDSSIVAVIELDDASHQRASRKVADAKKDKALSSAEITIIRWNVEALPSLSDIQHALLSVEPPLAANEDIFPRTIPEMHKA